MVKDTGKLSRLTMDAREKLSTGPQATLPDSTPARTENDAEDVRLMLLVRDGDLKAFETLVERHQQAVLGTVAKMLGHPTDAEDIAQQVFIRIWKSAARYEAQAKFTTWLFTIARNLVFNEMRRRQRKPTSSLEEREEVTGLSTPDHEGAHLSPAESALHREMELAIDNAIQALPEKQRLAVILRRYEDMPYEQIGEVLNLSVPAVKSLLFRARTQLKELLKDYLD
ncbi:MAG: sigma-70 family RNA polymerase sigma factor [Verrucomicrobiales bacterium]